ANHRRIRRTARINRRNGCSPTRADRSRALTKPPAPTRPRVGTSRRTATPKAAATTQKRRLLRNSTNAHTSVDEKRAADWRPFCLEGHGLLRVTRLPWG